MKFSIQPILEIHNIKLIPLHEDDFERLYEVASDPDVWAMHPNKERYKREVFRNFFTGALESKGAFIVLHSHSNEIMGSTRFYDYNEKEDSIFIGYTFYGTKFWGKNINSAVKKMMLDYIFQFVKRVIFHVGKENIRSIKAMEKLGAKNLGEQEVAYFGESPKINTVFEITKTDWEDKN